MRNYRNDFNYQSFILYKIFKKKIDVFYFQINEQNVYRFFINNKNIIVIKNIIANNIFDNILNNFIISTFASNQSFLTSFMFIFINSLVIYYIKRFRKISISSLDLIIEKFVENERIVIDIQIY